MTIFSSLSKPLLLALTLLLAMVLGLTGVATTQANGPGDLDTTFGFDGIITTTIEGHLAAGSAVAVQPDGKIVVAGRALNGPKPNLVIIRYLGDGSLDPNFGLTGVVTIPVKENVFGRTLVIQPDGKIVAASPDLLVRLLNNGNLDPDFGNEGKVISPIRVHALALQSDGKIVAAGNVTGIDGYNDTALARFKQDGSLDNTFHNGGVVTTSLFAQNDEASGIASAPDGKIVISAVSDNSTGYMIVARYNPTGDLDNTFNNTGIIFTPIGNDYNDAAYDVAVSPEGKVVVVGQASIGSAAAEQAVVRLTEAGSLDPTFAQTGVVTTMIGSNTQGNAVVLPPYGKILVAGASDSSGFPQFTLTRYTGEGVLDTSLNSTGIVVTGIDDVPGEGYDLALQADGKIVVAGFTYNFDIAVARYLGDPYLILTQIIDDKTPKPGQRVTHTLVISNASSTDATGAVISVTLPSGLIMAGKVSLEPAQAGAKLAQLPADLPYLAQGVTIGAGQIVTVSIPIMVTAKAGALITNTIAVTSAEIILPETDTISITVAASPTPDTYLPLIPKGRELP